MQRILILGCSGSGKSTLARLIGERLNLPVHHLDRLFWQPGWREHPDREAFQADIRALAAGERWIIDGGYTTGSAAERFSRADGLVLFDLPTALCLLRAVRRFLLHRGRSRPDMAPGCTERIDFDFLRYIWNYRRTQLPKIEAYREAHFRGRFIRLRSERDRRSLLQSLGTASDDRKGIAHARA